MQQVVSKRAMCPGVVGVEGTCHGHDAIKPASAVEYLQARGLQAAAKYVEGVVKVGVGVHVQS